MASPGKAQCLDDTPPPDKRIPFVKKEPPGERSFYRAMEPLQHRSLPRRTATTTWSPRAARLSRKNSMITESCLQTAQKPGRGEGGRTPEPCGGWWDRTHLCHRESVPRCSKLQARDVARTEPWGATSPGGTQGLSRDPSGAPRKMSGWTCQTGPLAWW